MMLSQIKNNLPVVSKRVFLCGVAMLALVGGGVVIAFQQEVKAAAQAANVTPAMVVSATKPIQQDWAGVIKASGPIEPWQEATIGTELNGQRLVELHANVGDKVKKGQLLAKFNTDTLLAEYARLKASFQQAEADRIRAEKLKGSQAMSDQQLIQYQTAAKIARADLDAKEIQLKNAEIIAPADGSVSARSATLGMISNNNSELFRLICDDRLEWRGHVTAAQLNDISIGQKVDLTLPDGVHVNATIRQISPSLNNETRLATIYADIETSDKVHAGMFADGQIEVSRNAAITVPALSVVIRDGYTYVFKLGADKGATKATLQAVTVGQTKGNMTEIRKGVSVNDVIAVEGAGFLNDGDTVQITALSTSSESVAK